MFAIKGGGVGMGELGEGEKRIGKNVWDLDLDDGYMVYTYVEIHPSVH